jgi:hypothetical protein
MRAMMVFVLAASVGLASLIYASEVWAGAILLVTLGALSLSILGVVYRRGARQAFWLGFALLGWGYMVLAWETWGDRSKDRPPLATTVLLDRLYPHLQLERTAVGSSPGLTGQILAKLDRPIPIQFPDETPFVDVLKYIKAATQGANDNGIPIYIDPVGLQKAGKTMQSTVTLDLDGVPLKTSLRLLLHQLDLDYTVRNGLLTISQGNTAPFRRIGHCYWAILAACIGGIAGRLFYATRDPATGP